RRSEQAACGPPSGGKLQQSQRHHDLAGHRRKSTREGRRSPGGEQSTPLVHWPPMRPITIYESRRGRARSRRQPQNGPSWWVAAGGASARPAIYPFTFGLRSARTRMARAATRAGAELAMLRDNPREGLTFDDVLIKPGLSDVLPSDVDIRTRITRSIGLTFRS